MKPSRLLPVAIASFGLFVGWQDPVRNGARPAQSISAAARAFLDGLSREQKAKATAELGDDKRRTWGFVPATYPGVPFGELDAAQTTRAKAVLAAVLSARGHAKVAAIMALEDVLRAMEKTATNPAAHRDPQRYWLQFFGEPGDDTAWAFRLQGHHVSLHFAIEHDRLHAASPQFLGTNPHERTDQGHRGERVLAIEEDLARALLSLCDDGQIERVMIADKAPADVILGPKRAADFLGKPQGLPWSMMTPLQKGLLWRLIEEYVRVRHDEAADEELSRIDTAGRDGICFAWAGSRQRGNGHYYRIHGPTFVIEYDNTQNDANHVHTVLRDLERDFGEDALRAHYEHGHEHEPKKK